MLAGEGWHAGVIGIVASRLVERSGRPVVMIALDGDRGRGSGRSIDGVRPARRRSGLLPGAPRALRRAPPPAAGLEIERGSLPAFARALCDHARAALEGRAIRCRSSAWTRSSPASELGMDARRGARALAPFGRGNPSVSLMVDEASFADPRPMGEGKHVRFTVESGGARARAVAFGNGGRLPVADGEPSQATFSLEVNEWNGVSEPRLVLRRARAPAADPEPAAPPAAEDGARGTQ